MRASTRLCWCILTLVAVLLVAGCGGESTSEMPVAPGDSAEAAEPKPLPDVVSVPATEAVSMIRSAVGPNTVVLIFSDTEHGGAAIVDPGASRIATTTVTSQSPEPGATTDHGAPVELYLGDGSAEDGAPEGAGPGWFRHPPTILKEGAEPCFECHKETDCSDCHVNLAGKGAEGEPFSELTSSLKGLAQKTMGLGSESAVGMRDVVFRDDKDGPTYTVEITAPQFASVADANGHFRAAAAGFAAAVARDSRLDDVERVEFAWFQIGDDLPALREIYGRQSGDGAFRRTVPYYAPNVARFVD